MVRDAQKDKTKSILLEWNFKPALAKVVATVKNHSSVEDWKHGFTNFLRIKTKSLTRTLTSLIRVKKTWKDD